MLCCCYSIVLLFANTEFIHSSKYHTFFYLHSTCPSVYLTSSVRLDAQTIGNNFVYQDFKKELKAEENPLFINMQ